MSLRITAAARRGAFTLEAQAELSAGRTTVILGPNGSGKSTLIGVIAGLVPLAAGRVEFNGRVFEDVAARRRLNPQDRNVGLVPQGLFLFPHLTLADNVAFPLRCKATPAADARREALAWLDQFGIAHRADAHPADVSGGEAQRTALARALIGRPDILLLDEPLSALDAASRRDIRAFLRRRLTAFEGVRILVTHDPTEAMALGDRLVVIEEGRVVQIGGVGELRRAPASAFIASFVGLNLHRGVVRIEAGLMAVDGPDGRLYAAAESRRQGDEVLALVRPQAISLHRARPEGSARNLLEGTISAIRISDGHARIELQTHPPLTAEVTAAALRDLHLRVGDTVWASFKATEVEIYET